LALKLLQHLLKFQNDEIKIINQHQTEMVRFTVLLLVALAAVSIDGHGRFMKPPNRSSIWRVPEFASQNPPANYDDNQLYCGALHQLEPVGGPCGVCGDRYTDPTPRDNEIGGKWDRGIITGFYSAGQVIDVEVDLNAAHLGYMEWRMCANPQNGETQECFNQNLLQRADGQGSKLNVDKGPGWYRTQLRLPAGVTCNRCVIQWNYRAGNNPTPAQETFRGCSDVRIN